MQIWKIWFALSQKKWKQKNPQELFRTWILLMQGNHGTEDECRIHWALQRKTPVNKHNQKSLATEKDCGSGKTLNTKGKNDVKIDVGGYFQCKANLPSLSGCCWQFPESFPLCHREDESVAIGKDKSHQNFGRVGLISQFISVEHLPLPLSLHTGNMHGFSKPFPPSCKLRPRFSLLYSFGVCLGLAGCFFGFFLLCQLYTVWSCYAQSFCKDSFLGFGFFVYCF